MYQNAASSLRALRTQGGERLRTARAHARAVLRSGSDGDDRRSGAAFCASWGARDRRIGTRRTDGPSAQVRHRAAKSVRLCHEAQPLRHGAILLTASELSSDRCHPRSDASWVQDSARKRIVRERGLNKRSASQLGHVVVSTSGSPLGTYESGAGSPANRSAIQPIMSGAETAMTPLWLCPG